MVERSEMSDLTPPFEVHQPKFLKSSLQFDDSKAVRFGGGDKGIPSPAG